MQASKALCPVLIPATGVSLSSPIRLKYLLPALMWEEPGPLLVLSERDVLKLRGSSTRKLSNQLQVQHMYYPSDHEQESDHEQQVSEDYIGLPANVCSESRWPVSPRAEPID